MRILQLAIDELLCYFLEKDERFERPSDSLRPTLRNDEKSKAKLVIDRAALERAVAQLPFDYRLIFLLHDFERLTHEEIARILKIDIETSKSGLHEARVYLRRQIVESA